MLTRSQVLALAWPVVLAQVATALTGVVDTGVMARVGDPIDLAAVAVASVTFSFLYWAFGFLRMATTGLTAQANGRDDRDEVSAVLVRALALGAGLGLGLIVAFPALRWAALALFGAESAVELEASGYMTARIWGAPAALMGYAVTGWLLGTGRTRALLGFQVVLNGVNATLDATFVAAFDWGATGIGAGTAIAEWTALGLGLWLVRDGLGVPPKLWDRQRWVSLIVVNRDVMIRTLALLSSFAWFVNAGTRESSAVVAGNQVLLQLIAVSAFVLDAFAFVAEKEAGEAVGAGDGRRLRHAIRLTTEIAVVCGVAFSLLFALGGRPAIAAWVTDPGTRGVALAYLPYCAAVPILGVAAWQLDGVFLGATGGRALRNAALVATALYIALDWALQPWGNTGIWVALPGVVRVPGRGPGRVPPRPAAADGSDLIRIRVSRAGSGGPR